MVLSDVSLLPERIPGGSKMCHINCLDAVGFVFLYSSICTVAASLGNIPAARWKYQHAAQCSQPPSLSPAADLLGSACAAV